MIATIVIPTRDKAPLLAQTLDALRGLEPLPEPWEIVVVDDGSADETPDCLAAAAAGGGLPLRVVRHERGLGRAAARNRGAQEASGRWVLFLDDDIVAPSDLLRAHLELIGGRRRWGTIGRVATAPGLVDAPHFHYLDSRGVAKVRLQEAPARYFVTQNAMLPRDDFLAVGGFDARFTAWGLEDMEIAFRLEDRRGLRFAPLLAPVPLHVHHHTLSELLAKKRECGRHSLPLLARLHPERLREMRLHLVIDVPGSARAPLPIRWLRSLATGGAARLLVERLERWPCDAGMHPRLERLHALCMDAAILAAYRQGVVTAEDQT